MYGIEYKNSKSGKEVKEKEDKSDIYKDKSQPVKKFVPSLEMTKEVKKRTFIPSLTPELKQKRTNFTPSMELPKESKKRTFTPTLDIDTNKKRRNFTPSLEMTEKKKRDFIPDFNLKDDKELHEKRKKSTEMNEIKYDKIDWNKDFSEEKRIEGKKYDVSKDKLINVEFYDEKAGIKKENRKSTIQLVNLLREEIEGLIPANLEVDGRNIKMFRDGKLSFNKLSFLLCRYGSRLKRIIRNTRANPEYKISLDELQKWENNIKNTLGYKGRNAINLIELYRISNPDLPISSEFKVLNYHPNLKMDYFKKINTKEKAYWLGVLWAEVYIGKGSAIDLQFNKRDEILIDRYIKALGLTHNAKKYFKRKTKTGIESYVRIRFRCIKIVGDLLKHGYIPPKFKKTGFPSLNSRELDLAFLLGFFDGEGKEGTNQLHLGSRKILDQIKKKFGKDIPHDVRPDKEGYWYLSLGGKLFNELLDNYNNSLERKRKKFRIPSKKIFEDSITKDKLQNLVWTVPIKEICKKFGVYHRVVVELCEKWNIDRPPSHYWHNKLHGKSFNDSSL